MLLKINPNNKEQFKLRGNKYFYLIKHYKEDIIDEHTVYFEDATYAIQNDEIILLLSEIKDVNCNINTKLNKTKDKDKIKYSYSYKTINTSLFKVLLKDAVIIAIADDFLPL